MQYGKNCVWWYFYRQCQGQTCTVTYGGHVNIKPGLFKSHHYKILQKRQNYNLLSILLTKLRYSEDIKTL